MGGTKQLQLLNSIATATRNGKIGWEAAPNAQQTYRAKIGSKWVTIAQKDPAEIAEPDTYDYELSILDGNGNVIDSFLDTQLFDLFESHFRETDTRPYQIMRDVYYSAARFASGADTAIDEIINALNDGLPF